MWVLSPWNLPLVVDIRKELLDEMAFFWVLDAEKGLNIQIEQWIE
jgi:hypothetical protein